MTTTVNREQQYCISARDRVTGYTDSITKPMSLAEAKAFTPGAGIKKHYKYFRVAKYPFKRHKK